MAHDQLTGFVLAGGKSTRMGNDKAALSVGGKTLLDIALTTVRTVARQVTIVGSAELYGGHGPTIADIFPGCGPLGGIHTALSHTKTEFNLMLAVDTPFLSAKLLAYLAQRAFASRMTVTAPVINSYPQPLCAVYTHDFLSVAATALKAGDYKIVPLFPQGRTLLIEEAELARFAFTAEMFDNLNTPEDLERARRRGSDKSP
ncbi:MAG TPA: molybdenum cofactor guanylyltransferase [Candidatus Angelobacter sp.]|nr:molybdenum cofactor guanylyltransferase [Candidatus Angelobacter sp.]